MKSWEVLAALIALATGMWGYVKGVAHWLSGFVVATQWLEDDTVEMVASYLAQHGHRTAREPAYNARNYFVRPLNRRSYVMVELLAAGSSLLWHRRRPLWLRHQKEGLGGQDNIHYTISFVRGTIDFEALLVRIAEWRSPAAGDAGYTECRFKVNYHHGKTLGAEIARQSGDRQPGGGKDKQYRFRWNHAAGDRLLGWRPEDLTNGPTRATFDGLALTKELIQLVDEVRFWHRSQGWYHVHGVSWRRGYCFHGEPGTGKTSMIRAIAEELDLPVHVFDLAGMSNEDLREAWSEMQADAPCVALIEDIDAVFSGRENIAPPGGMMGSGGLTFDALLNCIDGVECTDGILFVVTTNRVETLDSALVDRAGRVDRIVKFERLDLQGRLSVARRILGDCPEAERLARESKDVPASKFVELCCRRALSDLFTRREEAAENVVELRREVVK